MTFNIGIIGAGNMGSAVGARLTAHGARILTCLEGRSATSRDRAKAAGMWEVNEDQIVEEAAIILSIVPPAESLGLAKRFAAALGRKMGGAVFVDCNAVSVSAMTEMGRIFEADGAHLIDGCIIGTPPKEHEKGPKFYLSGDFSGDILERLMQVKDCGLDIRLLNGPAGTASALKLSYAGITKGLTALGACMILAAERAGSGPALKQELAASQPEILKRLSKSLPDMYSKAYRWVDEMNSISDLVGGPFPENGIFTAAAALYERMAADFTGAGKECAMINTFLDR